MLAWLDLETTGLDPREHRILEVGIIITDDDLVEIWRVSRVCRYLGDPASSKIHPTVRTMHEASGLWAECAATQETVVSVEKQLCTMLRENRVTDADGKGIVPMCGSTIGFDRSFLREWMPRLLACFHYRSIDVSTLTELARRWFPEAYAERPGADESNRPHRALPDLENSIAQLRHYRETMFRLHEYDEDYDR